MGSNPTEVEDFTQSGQFYNFEYLPNTFPEVILVTNVDTTIATTTITGSSNNNNSNTIDS